MTADEYERLVLAGFVASGTPIILWQLLRHFRWDQDDDDGRR